LTFTNILSGQHTSPPVWAPITPQVAVGTVQDDIAQLKTIDVASGNIRTAFESTEIQIIKPYSWSPDGEWILFYAIDDKRSGLYVIHLSSGTFYQIMDTSTGNFPLELVWLPDLEPNSK
jgi:Tol biopolymer transport system component